MPEGHTLHRVARAWQPLVGSRVHTSSPQGRFEEGARRLDGRVVTNVSAFGKHLLADFGGVHLHIHLGLAGSIFQAASGGAPSPGVRLRIAAEAPGPTWDVVAPIRCELLSDCEREVLLARLGPDPLRGDDPVPAFTRMASSSKPVGALLLDQSVIAGVGNVFRAEVLFLCHIHPGRPGTSLSPRELRCLWETLTRLMERATTEGRIVTVDTPMGFDRTGLDQADGRYVYKQPTCRSCGTDVQEWKLANRTAYACPVCQPAA